MIDIRKDVLVRIDYVLTKLDISAHRLDTLLKE